jgi:hypothetical protein
VTAIAGPAGTLTGGAVSPAADHAAMRTDLDFQGFGVLGAGERFVGQATTGAALLVWGQVVGFFDWGQVVMRAMSRSRVFRLLAAPAFSAAGRRGFLRSVPLFRLLAEQLMFQLCNSGLEFLDFVLEFDFPLLGALELGFPIAGLLSLVEQLEPQGHRVLKPLFGGQTRDRS